METVNKHHHHFIIFSGALRFPEKQTWLSKDRAVSVGRGAEAAAKDSPSFTNPPWAQYSMQIFLSSAQDLPLLSQQPLAHTCWGGVRSLLELEVSALSCCFRHWLILSPEFTVITVRGKVLSFFFWGGGWRGCGSLETSCTSGALWSSTAIAESKQIPQGCPPKHPTIERQITCVSRASNVEGLNAWIVCGPRIWAEFCC